MDKDPCFQSQEIEDLGLLLIPLVLIWENRKLITIYCKLQLITLGSLQSTTKKKMEHKIFSCPT